MISRMTSGARPKNIPQRLRELIDVLSSFTQEHMPPRLDVIDICCALPARKRL